MTKVLVATEKPFSKAAVNRIDAKVREAGYELKLLEKYSDKSDLLAAVADVQAIIIRSDKIDAEVIAAAPELKIVVRAGAGYDNVDLSAASEKGVVVMNTPGQNSNAVAELALGMMVYLNRKSFNGSAGSELRGKTIGIHAYGYVGKLVATIAKGFGMEVYAYDPFVDDAAISADGVSPVSSAEELYKVSKYVSLHIPANDKTKGSINAALLNSMPEGAMLVNTARKEVINEDEMLTVMESRKDFRYVSDIAPDCKSVFEEKYEGRFFFTPKKMGAQTAEANLNAGIAAIEQIISYLENNDTTFQVNK